MRQCVRHLRHHDARPHRPGREELVVAVVRAAESHRVGRPDHAGAVVDHLPALIRQRPVRDPALRNTRQVARHDRVHELCGAGPRDVDLPQHREVHQCSRLAASAILVCRRCHDCRGQVSEEVHPLVSQGGEARIKGCLPASGGGGQLVPFSREAAEYSGTRSCVDRRSHSFIPTGKSESGPTGATAPERPPVTPRTDREATSTRKLSPPVANTHQTGLPPFGSIRDRGTLSPCPTADAANPHGSSGPNAP